MILVTGSADGLGRASAGTLLTEGHDVVVHVRSRDRLGAVRDLLDRGAHAVVGDLAHRDQIRDVAAQVRDLGRMDAVIHNAVDPGWVPTRMGGPSAPDDLRLGHLTQEWLVTSHDPEALVSGGYWHHQRREEPHPGVLDVGFQDSLLASLAEHTGVTLDADARP